MTRASRLVLFFLGLVLAAGASAGQQQPPGYVERVEVSRVLIDARVVDDAGRPVRGLGAEDFSLRIGGKDARIESVQWVSGTAEEDPRPPASIDRLDEAQPTRGRLVVFVLQKSLERGRIFGFMRMLIETRGFLDELSPADRVAVLSFDKRLRIWLDFTGDRERIRGVLQRVLFETPGPVQEGPSPSLIARLDPEDAQRAYSIEAALRLVGEALEELPGAKSVVLVGHGFGRLGRNFEVHMEPEYDRMREALQAARASVFCLDITEADYHSLEAGLQFVAEDTGGFFARTHIFHEQALARLAGALAGHYVLFAETPILRPGTHGVRLKLTRGDGHVLAPNTWDNMRLTPASR